MTTYDKSPQFLTHSYPQENTLYLPSGAVARLGKGCAFAVRFSPDGNLIAVGSRIGVWLYDAHTYVFVSLIAVEDTGVIHSFAFSPDSLLLATGDWDGYIKLWEVSRSENIATIKGHRCRDWKKYRYTFWA